jgi:hypothetical protein
MCRCLATGTLMHDYYKSKIWQILWEAYLNLPAKSHIKSSIRCKFYTQVYAETVPICEMCSKEITINPKTSYI